MKDLGVWIIISLVGLVFASIAGLLVWKIFAYGPIYTLSEGTMQTRSAKISYKGWIWKTHEGWIPLGMNSEGMMKKWRFTATNKEVVDCLNNNKSVVLYYKDYVGMPFRMGKGHQVYKCEGR